jgi:hypothetical protein
VAVTSEEAEIAVETVVDTVTTVNYYHPELASGKCFPN